MKIIEDLRQTNSRTQKEQLLKCMTDLERLVFYYAYHPHMRYGITNIAPTQELGEPSKAMFNLLNELADNNINDSLRQKVEDFRAEHGDLIVLICRKDLDCGVTATTLNKVFPSFVPVFKVQLAKEVPLNELEYPISAQIKYDGVRVIILAADGWCKLFTRNGKLINFPSLSESLAVLLKGVSGGVMLDGELTNKAGTTEGRTTISGRVNSAIKGGVLSSNDITFNVFDTMLVDEFNAGKCKYNYYYRYERLRKLVKYIDSDIIVLAHTRMVNNAEEADDYYTSVLEQGYEGLVLKDLVHKYTFKRSKDWVKVKSTETADLKCVKTINGKSGTKYEACIGAIVCKGTIQGKDILVKVGSGLLDTDREKDSDFFLNQTIEVKYNGIIPAYDGNGYTLFLPRFVCVRFDK